MGANRAGHVSHMSSRRELTSILSERLMKAELLQPLTEGYKFSKSLSIRLYLRWFYKGSRSLPTFTGITVTTANLCSHGVGVLMTVCNNRGDNSPARIITINLTDSRQYLVRPLPSWEDRGRRPRSQVRSQLVLRTLISLSAHFRLLGWLATGRPCSLESGV